MGANTYIGNAPNFMVKSIADENGVRMSSFLAIFSGRSQFDSGLCTGYDIVLL